MIQFAKEGETRNDSDKPFGNGFADCFLYTIYIFISGDVFKNHLAVTFVSYFSGASIPSC